jgi:hypothetical protein
VVFLGRLFRDSQTDAGSGTSPQCWNYGLGFMFDTVMYMQSVDQPDGQASGNVSNSPSISSELTTPLLRLPRPGLLVRVSGVGVLARPDLAALLVDNVLDPDLLAVRLLEVADEARVPQLRRDAQVLAAPQQRVRLAPLARRRDRLFGKVLALAARLGNESVFCLLVLVLYLNGGEKERKTNRPCTTSAYSRVTTFSPTTSSPRGASPHPPGPKALFRMRRYLISGR